MELIYEGGILLILSGCMLYDLRERKIPNSMVLVLLFFGIVIRMGRWGVVYLRYSSEIAAWYGSGASFLWTAVRSMLAGGFLPLVILFPLYLLQAVGAGDVKLLTVLGALHGWPGCLRMFLWTAVWAAGISVYCMLRKGIFRERFAYLYHYLKNLVYTRTFRAYGGDTDRVAGHLPVSVPIFLGELTCLILKGGL